MRPLARADVRRKTPICAKMRRTALKSPRIRDYKGVEVKRMKGGT